MSKRLFVHSRWTSEGDCEVLATVSCNEEAYFILTNESNKIFKTKCTDCTRIDNPYKKKLNKK